MNVSIRLGTKTTTCRRRAGEGLDLIEVIGGWCSNMKGGGRMEEDYEPGGFGDLNSGGRIESGRNFKRDGLIFVGLAILVTAVVVAANSDHRASRSAPQAQVGSSEPVAVAISFFACRDHDYFEQFEEFKDERDNVAASKAYFRGLATGECEIVRGGTLVYVVTRAFLSGLIQVRPRGSTDLLWTQPSVVGMR
jgi:hypothetical protein